VCGLAEYAWHTFADEGPLDPRPGWHRSATGGLASAIVWLEAKIVVATGRVLAFGADPAGWSAEAIADPLIVGWVGLAIIASAARLLPAIRPGDHLVHAHQRPLLGRVATVRRVVLNAAVAAMAIGLPVPLDLLVTGGVAFDTLGLGITAALLVTAVVTGVRHSRT
jgi:hypothetical protein